MAKFVFKLQPLLSVKSQQEDNQKNELGKAMRQLENEKAVLRRLEDEAEELIRDFNEKSKKCTVEKLIKFNEYLSFLNSRIKRQKVNVNCAARNVDKVREELIRIVRERKILDNLKERRRGQFLFEQQKEEQRLNDEIVSYKHKEKDTGE
jgi:flagellar FliJ protein